MDTTNTSKKDMKYISLQSDKYWVNKQINGYKVGFGRYSRLDVAIKVRDLLIKNNWGEPVPLPPKRYICERTNGYEVQKLINNKNVYFGTYKTLQEAQEVRDELIKNNWNKKKGW